MIDEKLRSGPLAGWYTTALWLGLAAAAAWLLLYHRVHVIEVLPFLLLLSCPLMHLFGHHRHGGHHNHRAEKGDPAPLSKERDNEPR